MKLKYPLLFAIIIITGCTTQKVSTIVGGSYDKNKDQTDYIVFPFGATSLPGKWTKTSYNTISKQQFFKNEDSISIAIAFTSTNNYEFNTNNSKKGFEFVKAFYEWESDYFVNHFKLTQEMVEQSESGNYIIWRAFGENNNANFDTYFLFGEKNGNASNFSIAITDKWSKEEKMRILKEMYVGKQQ